MAKKLKKKIEEVCGLVGLDRDARLAKAQNILGNMEHKQELCNSLVGLSFRELDKVLKDVIAERQVKEVEEEKVYKNEKLMTYAGKKPTPQSKSKKPPSRTLEEILAKVHSSRHDEAWTPGSRETHSNEDSSIPTRDSIISHELSEDSSE